MFRDGGVIRNKFAQIQKVKNGGYIKFYLQEGKTIVWKKRVDEEKLLKLLAEISTVEEGGLF